ncbi:hypothetical protein [Embleya sp. NPDC059259]|uniref:hypothetical protein n=1 Tax=unclassified Embleya TaxID=2699296 RepID=UPI0036BBFBBB
MVKRMERYGNGGLELDFRQIAVTADDVRSGRFTTHDVNTADANYRRYREECLREDVDPHLAVEVEALDPGLLRRRLEGAIEALIDDIDGWNALYAAQDRDRTVLRAITDAIGETTGTATTQAGDAHNDRP